MIRQDRMLPCPLLRQLVHFSSAGKQDLSLAKRFNLEEIDNRCESQDTPGATQRRRARGQLLFARDGVA